MKSLLRTTSFFAFVCSFAVTATAHPGHGEPGPAHYIAEPQHLLTVVALAVGRGGLYLDDAWPATSKASLNRARYFFLVSSFFIAGHARVLATSWRVKLPRRACLIPNRITSNPSIECASVLITIGIPSRFAAAR